MIVMSNLDFSKRSELMGDANLHSFELIDWVKFLCIESNFTKFFFGHGIWNLLTLQRVPLTMSPSSLSNGLLIFSILSKEVHRAIFNRGIISVLVKLGGSINNESFFSKYSFLLLANAIL